MINNTYLLIFYTLSFDQEDKIEIVQLTLQDSLILISGVDGVISIECSPRQ